MTGLPPEAVQAAAEAIERKLLTEPPDGHMTWLEANEELARAALEAAAPHLAAAEREQSEARHMAYLADLSREYGGNLRASVAAEREATVTAMYAGAAKAVENAVAAERERCVQLAHEYRAVYVTGNVIEGLETHPFADLLRQDGGARVAEDVQSNDC